MPLHICINRNFTAERWLETGYESTSTSTLLAAWLGIGGTNFKPPVVDWREASSIGFMVVSALPVRVSACTLYETSSLGKKKAHKHKQFCPAIAWVKGGVLPTGWPGVKCSRAVCANPNNINIFVRPLGREERWPEWPRNCSCAKCLRAFSGPYKQWYEQACRAMS